MDGAFASSPRRSIGVRGRGWRHAGDERKETCGETRMEEKEVEDEERGE